MSIALSDEADVSQEEGGPKQMKMEQMFAPQKDAQNVDPALPTETPAAE